MHTSLLPPRFLLASSIHEQCAGLRQGRSHHAVDEQADAIGKQFVQHYYQVFKTDRASLGRLYHGESVLNYQQKVIVGQQAIAQHLQGLPFGNIDFQFTAVDCQPTVSAGVLVFVTGKLITEGETRPLNFSQVFLLVNANGSWLLSNDIFSLNYG